MRLPEGADPAHPVVLRWDPIDRRWGFGTPSYRYRLLDASNGAVVAAGRTSAVEVRVGAGTLRAGGSYRFEVDAGGATGTLTFTATPDLDGDAIPDRLENRLAHRFAPLLRFNRRVRADRSGQNRTELYYPSSIEYLNEAIHSEYVETVHPRTARRTTVLNWTGGRPEVVIDRSGRVRLGDLHGADGVSTRFTGTGATASAERRLAGDLSALSYRGKPLSSYREVWIDGVPRFLPGNRPGTAPTYVHVYGRGRRALAGGGAMEWYGIEYWVFYPQDWSWDLNLPFFKNTAIGHRGDWEHIVVVIERTVDAAGNEQSLRLAEAVYHGHGRAIRVSPQDLRLVDGAGKRSPSGTHPEVYVAVGKHASFPAPGVLRNGAPFYDDVFHGNGVVVRTWKAGLVNLGERGRAAAGCEWLSFTGRWGTDVFPFGLGSSPIGPAAKSSWGRLKITHNWTSLRTRLVLDP